MASYDHWKTTEPDPGYDPPVEPTPGQERDDYLAELQERGLLPYQPNGPDRIDRAGDILDAASEIKAAGETLMSFNCGQARADALRAARAVIDQIEDLEHRT